MKSKKIGLFGGSFDPIHNSHIKIINEVLRQELVEEIWVIPCYNHNFGKDLVSFDERAEMVSLAFENRDKVKLCEVEKELGGVTRTYDTVTELKGNFDHEFFWICGSDCVQNFNRWHRAEDLAREIKFIVYLRKGFDIGEDSLMEIEATLNVRADDVSSSNIRVRIKNDEDVSKLVSKEVLDYLIKENLYK
jgi:nicotinate-nucleotide adenylyltransferase